MADFIKYFAYGSNLHSVRLQQRVPSCSFLDVAKLTRYQLKFHKHNPDGSGKCNLLYTGDEKHEVFGVIYNIFASEKGLLDEAEGVGQGYDVTEISLSGEKGPHTAFSYVAHPEYINDALYPYPWYKALVVTGAKRHQLPGEYIANLESLETVDDPDIHRVDHHMRIVRAALD